MADPTIVNPPQFVARADVAVADSAAASYSPPDAVAGLLGWLDRHRWWVFGLLAVVYLAGYTGRWLVNPDSALYVSLGRNVAEGLGYTYQGRPHTWAEPGLPYLIAGTFEVVGVDDMRLATLAMLLCAAGSLALTYALFTLHAGRPVAVLIVALVGLSENFHRYGYLVLTDMPFLLGAAAFLVGYENVLFVRPEQRRWWGWALVAVGTLLMLSFRPTVLMFLAALAVATAWHLRPEPGWLAAVVRRDRRQLGWVAAVLVRSCRPCVLAAGRRRVAFARDPERRPHVAVAAVGASSRSLPTRVALPGRT